VSVAIQVPIGPNGWTANAPYLTEILGVIGDGTWGAVTLPVPENPYPELGYRIQVDCKSWGTLLTLRDYGGGNQSLYRIGDVSGYWYPPLSLPFSAPPAG
jgi:hypothetical protein